MDIDAVVEEIRQQEEARRAEAERLREEVGSTLFTDGGAVEDAFVHAVEPDPLGEVTVAGVDGGLVRKEFHGLDLLLARAVAAVFSYSGGELDAADYVPATNPTPRVEHLTATHDRQDADRAASLLRLEEEIGAARETVDDTDVLLLDGSILPQFPDKPRNGATLRDRYDAVVDRYRDLYTAATDSDVILAGVVEDTRGTDCCDLLRANGFDGDAVTNGRDTTILADMLEKGERTLLMEYGDADSHPILQDLPAHAGALYSFYLKPVKNDRPVRIDLFAPHDPVGTAETVASHIYALAGMGSSYAVPPVLIEADQRAKIEPHEVDLLTKRVRAKLAHHTGTEELRRDRRPF